MERIRQGLAAGVLAGAGVVLLALLDHALAGSLGLGAPTPAVVGAAGLGALLLVPALALLAMVFGPLLARPWRFRVEVFLFIAILVESLWSLGVYLHSPRLPLVIEQIYRYAYGAGLALPLAFLAARTRFAREESPSKAASLRIGMLALSLWGLWWNPHFRQYPSQIATASVALLALLGLAWPLRRRSRLALGAGGFLVLAALWGALTVGGSAGARDQAARGGRGTRLLLRIATPLLRPFGQTLDGLAAGAAPVPAPATPVHPLEAALAATKPRNVLIITVDALRADLGGALDDPTFARLASEGVRFTNARSAAANTIESMTMNFLGRYYFNGIRGDALPTLFREAGFFAINIQPIAFLNTRGGHKWVEQDFDHFVGTMKYKYLLQPVSDQMTDAMLAALEKPGDKPFFAWMHYNDPHHPYDAEGEDDPARYRAEVSNTFREIGRLLDGMQARGLLDNTMILLTADHGEEFGEHGGTTHSLTLYDEVLRVPLVIRAPGGAVRGTYEEPTSLAGVAPALLRWLGVPDRAGFAPGRRDLFAGAGAPLFAFRRVEPDLHFGDGAVILGYYKLLYSFEVEAAQLYDLSSDPDERHNLADERPEETRRLAATLRAELTRALPW